MSLLIKKLVSLVTVCLLFTLIATCQSTQKDSVLIAISDIRKANQVFVERDYLSEVNNNLTKIVSIQTITIYSQDSVISNLNKKVSNLNTIMLLQDSICDYKISVVSDKLHKRTNQLKVVSGSSIALILILILL